MNDPIENNIKSYTNSLETRVALVEMAIVNINQTLIRLENKIDFGFSECKADSKSLSCEIKEIRKDMRYDFRWTLTIIGVLGAVMAHGFHWF